MNKTPPALPPGPTDIDFEEVEQLGLDVGVKCAAPWSMTG
jgi:hypothetical protein